jgi:hypothetical protein
MRLYAANAGRHKLTWATAMTECDDPQFFLIGPEPEAACLTAISRVGGRYVLEDGAARVVCESRDLAELVKRAQLAFAGRRKLSLVMRILLPFGAARAFFDEKVEPLIPDSVEVFLRLPAIV